MGKTAKDRRINSVLSVVLTIVCILWMYPVFMILMNSLKTERAITTTHAFELPTAETFVGLKNYIYGITEMDFLSSLWYSFIITISSVALILLCCSMCAWYITRVQGVLSNIKQYRTIPMAIQYFRGSYGKVEMAPMMACIMITVIPVIVLYLACQKYIIDGVVAGAVKG